MLKKADLILLLVIAATSAVQSRPPTEDLEPQEDEFTREPQVFNPNEDNLEPQEQELTREPQSLIPDEDNLEPQEELTREPQHFGSYSPWAYRPYGLGFYGGWGGFGRGYGYGGFGRRGYGYGRRGGYGGRRGGYGGRRGKRETTSDNDLEPQEEEELTREPQSLIPDEDNLEPQEEELTREPQYFRSYGPWGFRPFGFGFGSHRWGGFGRGYGYGGFGRGFGYGGYGRRGGYGGRRGKRETTSDDDLEPQEEELTREPQSLIPDEDDLEPQEEEELTREPQYFRSYGPWGFRPFGFGFGSHRWGGFGRGYGYHGGRGYFGYGGRRGGYGYGRRG